MDEKILNSFISYARLEHEDFDPGSEDFDEKENESVRGLVKAGMIYIQGALSYDIKWDSDLEILALNNLVKHWYDNRGTVEIGKLIQTIPFGVAAMLMQLDH